MSDGPGPVQLAIVFGLLVALLTLGLILAAHQSSREESCKAACPSPSYGVIVAKGKCHCGIDLPEIASPFVAPSAPGGPSGSGARP